MVDPAELQYLHLQLRHTGRVAATCGFVQFDEQPRMQIAPPLTPPWPPQAIASANRCSGPTRTLQSGRPVPPPAIAGNRQDHRNCPLRRESAADPRAAGRFPARRPPWSSSACCKGTAATAARRRVAARTPPAPAGPPESSRACATTTAWAPASAACRARSSDSIIAVSVTPTSTGTRPCTCRQAALDEFAAEPIAQTGCFAGGSQDEQSLHAARQNMLDQPLQAGHVERIAIA